MNNHIIHTVLNFTPALIHWFIQKDFRTWWLRNLAKINKPTHNFISVTRMDTKKQVHLKFICISLITLSWMVYLSQDLCWKIPPQHSLDWYHQSLILKYMRASLVSCMERSQEMHRNTNLKKWSSISASIHDFRYIDAWVRDVYHIVESDLTLESCPHTIDHVQSSSQSPCPVASYYTTA